MTHWIALALLIVVTPAHAHFSPEDIAESRFRILMGELHGTIVGNTLEITSFEGTVTVEVAPPLRDIKERQERQKLILSEMTAIIQATVDTFPQPHPGFIRGFIPRHRRAALQRRLVSTLVSTFTSSQRISPLQSRELEHLINAALAAGAGTIACEKALGDAVDLII